MWIKPDIGLHVGKNNYTPDIELSVQLDGLTHRALVEIKPAKSFMTTYIVRRMIGVARHYHSQVLLLYAEKEASWYRIDPKTGELSACAPPVPGKIPIKKLYKPLTVAAPRIYNHHYKRTAAPVIFQKLVRFTAETIATPFITPRKSRRSRKPRRH